MRGRKGRGEAIHTGNVMFRFQSALNDKGSRGNFTFQTERNLSQITGEIGLEVKTVLSSPGWRTLLQSFVQVESPQLPW